MRYEFWQHAKSGEVWAVEIVEAKDVETGAYISEGFNRACGPLSHTELKQYPDPSEYHFDDFDEVDVPFFEGEEFLLYER